MEIQIIKSSDPVFAESLTKTNMAAYYQTRNINWDHNLFLQSWEDLDNYEIYTDHTRIGVLRFSYSSDTTFLRDFQLAGEFQGRGFGSKTLELVVKHALNRHSSQMVLRVFSENPAIRLYESKGFIRTSEGNGLIEMMLPLSQTDNLS